MEGSQEEKELEDWRYQCLHFEERSKRTEEKCMKFEIENQKQKSDYDALEEKLRAIEAEKLAIGNELKALKKTNDEISHKVSENADNKELFGCLTSHFSHGRESGNEEFVDLNRDEEDKFTQLMIENKVLECEKKLAESNAEVWKEKCKELESKILQLEESLVSRSKELPLDETNLDLVKDEYSCHSLGKEIGGSHPAGTPYVDTPQKESGTQVRKHLKFEEERNHRQHIAPVTLGASVPASVAIINVLDSDDEPDTNFEMLTPGNERNEKSDTSNISILGTGVSINKEMISENGLNSTLPDQRTEEHGDGLNENIPVIPVSQRKRAFNVVTSDTESEDDDSIPICKNRRLHWEKNIPENEAVDFNSSMETAPADNNVIDAATPPRRRLLTLRQCEGKIGDEIKLSNNLETSGSKYNRGILTTDDVEDDEESEEVESDSNNDKLGGFIVDSSDISDGCDTSSLSGENISDDNMDYGEVLSVIRRKKDQNMEWKFEGDMLAALGKDPELCMKAVCALNRRQTSDEQASRLSLVHNNRGFNKLDAYRGSTLAQFLTGGDLEGDVKKSLKELQDYDPKAVEQCRSLALRYSKQLYDIYSKKEDPYFLPS